MNNADLTEIDARGMRCPWPVLRAARAMRSARTIIIRADDPIAGRELAALAGEHCWTFEGVEEDIFCLRRTGDERAS